MTTLADIRTRVRKDLHDTDAAAYRWPDTQLDRHIEHALRDLSLASPREVSATITTTPGDRDLDISGLAGLVEIEAVEYPAGRFPPAYVQVSRWDETLTLLIEAEPDGSDARIHYTAVHELDADSSTLPAHLEDILATGAGGYAATEWAGHATDRLNTGGNEVAERYAAWGRAALTAFRQLLREHGRKNAVRARRLYTPAR